MDLLTVDSIILHLTQLATAIGVVVGIIWGRNKLNIVTQKAEVAAVKAETAATKTEVVLTNQNTMKQDLAKNTADNAQQVIAVQIQGEKLDHVQEILPKIAEHLITCDDKHLETTLKLDKLITKVDQNLSAIKSEPSK